MSIQSSLVILDFQNGIFLEKSEGTKKIWRILMMVSQRALTCVVRTISEVV